jgi:OOP family OmpA-OmpF porin
VNSNMIFRKTALSLAIAAFATGASAAEPGWYLGASVGQASAKIDDDRIRQNLANQGLTMTSIDDDEHDFGFKLLGGYQFNRHFALEGGYFHPGEFNFLAQTSPPGTLAGNAKIQGLFLDPVLILPITEKFSAFGRAGVTYIDTESGYVATGSASAPPDGDKKTVNYAVGAGVQYDFTPRFGMRAELERYRIDDAVGTSEGDVDFASIGMVWRFVKAAPRVKPVPAQRAAWVPPPPPVYVIVPAPAKIVEYCSILDIEFEINLDEIQREEKEKLAVLGTFLKKYPDTTAIIEGHTDNVGKPEDKLALSQTRADHVVDFLVNKDGIARSRLQAVGYGDTRPVGDNATEDGKRRNRRIGAVIACAGDIEGLTVVPAQVTMALEMEFELNRADVRPQYRDDLGRVARFLKANTATTATIEGHTSNLSGSPEEAMELSQRRAEAVVTYLVDNFEIPRSRLSSEGFGQTRRVSYNTSKEGQKDNRRVNVIINYPRSR